MRIRQTFRYLLIALSLITTLLCAQPSHAEPPPPQTVRIAAFNFYPAIFQAKDGSVQGFYVDFLKEIAKREHWNIEYVYGSWADGLAKIKTGEVDVLTNVAFTNERATFMDYGKTQLLTVWAELYVPNSSDIDNIRQVKGKKIALMKGDFNAANFRNLVEKFEIPCEYVEYGNFEDVFKAISANQVDGGVVNNTFGSAKQREYSNIKSSGVIFNPFDIYFTVAKGKNQKIIDALDKYLTEWRKEEFSPYHQAREQWSHGSASIIQVIPAWLHRSLMLLLISSGVAIVFIIILRIQVRRKTHALKSEIAERTRVADELHATTAQLEEELAERQMAQEALQDQTAILEEEIEERRRAEDARTLIEGQMEQARDHYLRILSEAPALIWRANTDAQCDWFNDTWLNFTGRTLEQEYGNGWAEGVHPDDFDRCVEIWLGAFARRENFEMEYRLRHHDGEYRWLLDIGRPISGIDDCFAGYIGYCFDITERKRAEESLLASRDDLIETQRIARVGSWRLDIATNQVVWSEELYKIYGFDPTLPPPPYTEHKKLFTPKSWDRLTVALSNTKDSGIPYELELETVRENGGRGWMWVHGESVLDASGVTVGLRGATQDITERKLMVEAMRVSEEKFKALSDSSPLAIYVSTGVEQKAEYINSSFYKIFGFTYDDVPTVGHWWVQAFPDEKYRNLVKEQWQRNIELAVENNSDVEPLECTCVCKDGSQKYISWNAKVVGEQFWAFGLDLTERKQMESETNRLSEILAESQHIAHVGGWEIDLVTNFLFWSHETYLIHDTTPEEYTPDLETAIAFYAPESVPVISAAVKKAIEEGKNFNLELKLITAKGRPITVHTTCKAIQENGKTIKIIGAFRDVTDQKHLEEQLRQSQKMEAIGQLAGGVAHDFNNILTVIMGYCSLLGMDSDLNQHQKEAAEHILASSEKAAQLTRGLLAFSRKQVLEVKKTNLNNIIHNVEKFLVRVIGEDIQFKSTHSGVDLPVSVDIGQIEQVLINLATNARDSMQGGGLLTMETGLQEIDATLENNLRDVKSGCYAWIAVSDTGCGMNKETLARIFEPFFTTKEVGKGTGLGMAIVYGIVQQHNGFINVYSELGQGTSFRIYLPITDRDDLPSVENTVRELPKGGTETILVAEDEPDVRKLVTTILTKFGYDVIQAVDGADVIEKFTVNQDRIGLILMDMIMPMKNGKEAYEEISKTHNGVKVLYSSGYTADFIQSRGVDEAAVELIMKPVQPIELLRKVREMLDS